MSIGVSPVNYSDSDSVLETFVDNIIVTFMFIQMSGEIQDFRRVASNEEVGGGGWAGSVA